MEPSSSQRIISPEDLLESLMNDGTVDAIRLKIITQLKANEELKNTTIKMVEQSKVLNTPGAEKQTKRELFDALRQELEMSVLEKASKSVWELIVDKNGLGKDIDETVERVFCQLSGTEPPFFPPSLELRSGKGKEKENGKTGGKERENTKENSESSSKKRKVDEISAEEGSDEAASRSNTVTALPDDSIKVPPSLKT